MAKLSAGKQTELLRLHSESKTTKIWHAFMDTGKILRRTNYTSNGLTWQSGTWKLIAKLSPEKMITLADQLIAKGHRPTEQAQLISFKSWVNRRMMEDDL